MMKNSTLAQKNSPTQRVTLAIVLLVTILNQAAVSLYLPVFPKMMLFFHASDTWMKASIAAYFMGCALAQLIYGPLSDRYGRKRPLMIGLVVFQLGCILAICSHQISYFVLARLIQGLGAGSVLTLGRSMLRDVFSGRALAAAMSYLSMAFALGLGLSPLFSGLLAGVLGWQYDFVLLMAYALLVLFAVCAYYKPPAPQIESHHASGISPLKSLVFWRYACGGIAVYTILVSLNTLCPLLLEGRWHFSPLDYAAVTAAFGLFYFLGALLNKSIVKRYGLITIIRAGMWLLLFSAAALVLLGVQKVWFAHAMIIVFLVICSGIQGLVFTNTLAGAIGHLSAATAGRASAILTFVQIASAALISSMLSLLSIQTVLPLAFLFLSIGVVLALCVRRHSSVHVM